MRMAATEFRAFFFLLHFPVVWTGSGMGYRVLDGATTTEVAQNCKFVCKLHSLCVNDASIVCLALTLCVGPKALPLFNTHHSFRRAERIKRIRMQTLMHALTRLAAAPPQTHFAQRRGRLDSRGGAATHATKSLKY